MKVSSPGPRAVSTFTAASAPQRQALSDAWWQAILIKAVND
jgi:hypothetical protein